MKATGIRTGLQLGSTGARESLATRSALQAIMLAGALCVCASFSTTADAAGGGGDNWTANGATACERFLTPDVLAATLQAPTGKPQRLDAHSCHTGIIYIYLKVADIDIFRSEVPRIAGAHPMAGVGDGAYWNEAGAISAVKGHDRGCDISVVGIPQQMKIHDAALGRKLGEICNKLFELP